MIILYIPIIYLGQMYLSLPSLALPYSIASSGQYAMHAIQWVQSPLHLGFPSANSILPRGHFSAQSPHPLQLSFAQTRTRNGKHESNSPSRFVREVDQSFIANPLDMQEDESQFETGSSSGYWGRTSGSTFRSANRYGQSSRPEVVRRSTGQPPRPAQPLQHKTEPTPMRRPQIVPQRVSDADFVPTPVLQLRAGQRIEHNRFGLGKILEISGNPADLKAKIAFDAHGEKILLLEYAKIRVINVEG